MKPNPSHHHRAVPLSSLPLVHDIECNGGDRGLNLVALRKQRQQRQQQKKGGCFGSMLGNN